VTAICEASGVRMRRISLKNSWWKDESGPLLVFRKQDSRPLALLSRPRRGFDYYDPVEERKRPLTKEVADSIASSGYVLYRPFPVKKISLGDLLKFGLHASMGDILTILAMGIATGILGMIIPFGTGLVFDHIVPRADRSQLMQLSLFLAAVVVVTSMFSFVNGIATVRLQGKLSLSLQAAIWDRLLSLPTSFFRKYSTGDLAQRSLGIARIQETIMGSALTAMLMGIFSIFNLGLLFYYSSSLALMAIGFVAAAFIVTVICGFFEIRSEREVVKLQNKLSGTLLQFIQGVAKLRIAFAERRAFLVWGRDFFRQKKIAIRARWMAQALVIFDAGFPVISLAGIFYYYQIRMPHDGPGHLLSGELLAFIIAFTQFLMNMLIFSSTFVAILRIVPLYEQTRPILTTPPEIKETRKNPGKLTGAIEISHASFNYDAGSPFVLRDVCLKIEPGQFIALVGASGSGKSTLFRLLLGFEKPESGKILYDGQDLSILDIQEVRRQLGVVLQSSRPMAGSILHNIIGSSPLTLQDAWDAAELAGIDADIRALPMGMHTHLSDGGRNISDGQRQRLMIARALVGKPNIILFDEATSALDNHTAAVVRRSLEKLHATRIVIAHRLSTVKNADVICVLHRGEMIEMGCYEQLMQKDGYFRELMRRQFI
jgi:NHLM bacteriocin system ABC transporter ATP-binding protein